MTVTDANFKVVLQSQIRNEYINGYSLVIIATFKDNHDIFFLIGHNGLDVTYYIIKYAMKKQMKFKNLAALELNAFDKCLSQEALPPIDLHVQIQRSQGISNMVCLLFSKQETAAPMACLYLLQALQDNAPWINKIV